MDDTSFLGLFQGEDLPEVLESLSTPIHIIDAQGILLYANSAWERMAGTSKETSLGHHINDVLEHSLRGFYFSIETDENTQEQHVTHFDQKLYCSVAVVALRSKKPVSMFTYSASKNKVLVTSSPLFRQGEVKYVVTALTDLTDSSNLRGQLDDAIEENTMISAELEFYRSQARSVNVVGRSKAMDDLRGTIEYVANTNATVLITGESGVGKEVLTNEIYARSLRCDRPFIKVNCASIPEQLIESELFGYERGAFTGANRSKPGLFELANTGTILLDEVGELPKTMQPKLLRVLQEREIMRVGGTSSISIDVRLIAATNQNLEEMVQRGEFRKDLYYRLNLIPIHIPPLRERIEDIPPLTEHFLEKFNKKYGKQKHITDEALAVITHYDWPGNVRELENLLERLVIIGDEHSVTSGRLLPLLRPQEEARFSASMEGRSLKEMVAQYECSLIQAALERHGTTYKAAEALQSSQATVARKAQMFGLEW